MCFTTFGIQYKNDYYELSPTQAVLLEKIYKMTFKLTQSTLEYEASYTSLSTQTQCTPCTQYHYIHALGKRRSKLTPYSQILLQ